MKMINKDENLLSFTTKQKNECRSGTTHLNGYYTGKKKKSSDNTEFWENVEKLLILSC